MVTSEETLKKIKKIIERHYAQLTISMLGKDAFDPEELQELKDAGVDVNNTESLLELTYQHNFLNNPIKPESPTSIPDMIVQQSAAGILPTGEAHTYTIRSQNAKVRQHIEKLYLDVATRLQGIIRDNNDSYKFNALQHLNRTPAIDALVKESYIGKIKSSLKDTSKQANRDWGRVAITEMSNMIGIGSTDRIVSNNVDKSLSTVYVYRIPVNDAVTCKWCKRFYGNGSETPKIYRLSTLLGNGSNYGKPTDQWRAVISATHPNTRTSQIIEVRPGFKVLPNGTMTYIGPDAWPEWIYENLTS